MKFAAAVASMMPLLFADEPLVEGNAKSLVRVVVYEDLQCSDCTVYRTMMDMQLLPKFGALAAFEHRDFPLPKHEWARKAAIAARFFGTKNPETVIAFRRKTLASQATINPANFNAYLSEFAAAHGVTPDLAIAALDDPRYAAPVEADYQEGIARGITKTPTVFVNAEPFIEKFQFEAVAKAIRTALDASTRQ